MRWVLLAMGLLPFSLAAATINPTEANLRAALGTESFILFASSGTITLDAPIEINHDVTIDGAGQTIVFDGQNATTLFKVNSPRRLTLKNLTLTRGRSQGANGQALGEPGGPAAGGAIQNFGGHITISDCQILQNSALAGHAFIDANNRSATSTGGTARGGAIYQTAGTLEITLTTLAGNAAIGGNGKGGAHAQGGAIYASDGFVTLNGCTITACAVTGGPSDGRDVEGGEGAGGAIYAQSTVLLFQGSKAIRNAAYGGLNAGAIGGAIALRANANATIRDSIIEENKAKGGDGIEWMDMAGRSGRSGLGGGLFLEHDSIANINGSTFTANGTQGGIRTMNRHEAFASDGFGCGGAICTRGTSSVHNSTFHQNWAEGTDRSALQEGGAFRIDSGSLTMSHSTLAGNISKGPVFSIGGGRINLKANIFGPNEGGNVRGVIEDAGFNLSADATPAFTEPTSAVNVDANLGPLGNYGGATPTIPILAGSPAINRVTDGFSPEFDQRGRRRSYGGHADAGAYESSAPFFVLGQIHGFVPADTTISHEPGRPEGSGRFLLMNLDAGMHAISFTGTDALFVPNPATLNLNADMLLDVRGYALQKFAWEPDAAAPTFSFAGRFDETWDFFASNDLVNWRSAGSHRFTTSVPYPIAIGDMGRPVYLKAVRR